MKLASSFALLVLSACFSFGGSYTVTFTGAETFNGQNGVQGLVFGSGSPSTANLAADGSQFVTQVDAPYSAQVSNAGAGSSFVFSISDTGLVSISGFGNLGNLLPVAVTGAFVVSNYELPVGYYITGVSQSSYAASGNGVQAAVGAVTSNGFTINLSDSYGFDAGGLSATYQIQTAAIPEPSSFALVGGLGALGCATLRRRRRA